MVDIATDVVRAATAERTPEEKAALLGIMLHAMREAEEADPKEARAEIQQLAAENHDPCIAQPIIPPRFAAATLNDYKRTVAELEDAAAAASQRAALDAVLDWRQRVIEGQPAMLALLGPTGVGKSHLLYAVVRSLVAAHVRVYTQPWYRLADALRYGGTSAWDARKILEAHALRAEIMGERVICLDDVRPTAGTAFDDTELGKLILDAWDRQSAMLITSNVSPLTAVISPPLASRFRQITIVGPDRRQA